MCFKCGLLIKEKPASMHKCERKTIIELEKELELTKNITIFEQRDEKRTEINTKIQALKEVSEVIDNYFANATLPNSKELKKIIYGK